MPFRDRSSLNRTCYGFAEASSSHSFGQEWRWVGMLCPSWAVGTEWLAISGYSGLLRVSWLELYWHTCNFPLTSNCRSVLLVKKNIVLFANSIICILDHCEKTTKWKWFKGKHFFSETFQVWYTARPSSSPVLALSQEPLSQPHVHASYVCPDGTIRKSDECTCCPLFFSAHVLSLPCLVFVASTHKISFCFFKSSQHKVSTDLYSLHLP